MTLILLHEPIASSRELQRVHMFPGRHLGEAEFDREQAYADARFEGVLQGNPPGIVHGLDIQMGPNSVNEPGFSVTSGLAFAGNGQTLGLYYPLRAEWPDLIREFLDRIQVTNAVGVYYLLLTRNERQINRTETDSCQRTDLDPTRDMQNVLAATLSLHRLNISENAVNDLPQEQIQNWVAADRVDGQFMQNMDNAVPLAMVAIVHDEAMPSDLPYRVKWISRAAGRYEALPNSGYRVLLNQTSTAMRRVMQDAMSPGNEATPLSTFLHDNLHLDFLPSTGQLPLSWLQQPESTHPHLLWIPSHIGIDMIPVPEETVPELMNRHIARRVIDLRQPAGDKIRLLLAVNKTDYRNDLLDIPQTDSVLEEDIFRFYTRTYEAWLKWRKQFDLLYYCKPLDQSSENDTNAPQHAVLDPVQLKNLGLPIPEHPPVPPLDVFDRMITQAEQELLEPQTTAVPYPYNKGEPEFPAFYQEWLVDGNPLSVPVPDEDGLVVQYAVALVELEAIENQIRAFRSRVEKTRDFLLIQRQQLDSQTVALAALAGGVSGDGTGLQVSRWLPYANLDTIEISKNTPETETKPEQIVSVAPLAAFSTPILTAFTNNTASKSTPKATAATSFSSNVMTNVLAATTTTFKPNFFAASKPETFSAFELGINQNRLNLLSQISREAVSKPAFEAKEYRFGVMNHISPEINEYAKAFYGIKELTLTLADLFDPVDVARLRRQFNKIGQFGSDNVPITNPFENVRKLESPIALDNLATKTAAEQDPENKKQLRELLLTQYRYHALFKTGKILTQWIALFEARYNDIERKLQGKLREQSRKLAQINKLSGLIRVAREALEGMDRFRVEQLGDYGVAQRLLEEDWRQVWSLNRERTRILTTGLRGLYYVRVRGTPVSARLADPLVLRHGSSKDVVPGCDWEEEVDLPAVLDPFFDAVREIPMNDWKALKPQQPKLPPFQQFEYLGKLRKARFQARPQLTPVASASITNTLQARLKAVQSQTQIVMQRWAVSTLPSFTVSSLKTQSEAAKVLSLEDLSGVSGVLRKEAHELRDQLEHCLFCLLEKLSLLPPSLRLQWGQLAEDDLIRVEAVSHWPGLENAEADDFNATRTISELIAWWFRQLDRDASANSRQAMRNMIRACLIHASLGDPQEIIRGNVHVPPRVAAVGERLQVKLNRPPLPGTRLQLLDQQQQVVALLAVEDHTPQSTQVRIVNLSQTNIRINTQFSVLANNLTQRKL